MAKTQHEKFVRVQIFVPPYVLIWIEGVTGLIGGQAVKELVMAFYKLAKLW